MIYFLRHLETFHNELGLISGQCDSPITKNRIVKDDCCAVSKIQSIYSSPSQRCIETLRLIPELPVSPETDRRLLERNMGEFENCSRQELYQRYPMFFKKTNGRISFRFELTPPQGESLLDFRDRIASFCSEKILPYIEYNILICSHNQTMKMIYFALKGFSLTEDTWNTISFPNGEVISYSRVQELFDGTWN